MMKTVIKTIFSFKFIFLLIIMGVAHFVLYKMVDNDTRLHLEHETLTLSDKASTLFDDQVNVRNWNDQYDGGVYVKPLAGQKPNPYLPDPTIETKDSGTLIRVNHAWMTRQLSELSKIKGYSFHATALEPINPENAPNKFEKKALEFMSQKNINNYYEFNKESNKFEFLGALRVEKSCLECHPDAKIGEIRGGISVILDANNFTTILNTIQKKAIYEKIAITLFIIFIIGLYFRVLLFNERLEDKIVIRTQEIQKTTDILQNLLSINDSLAIVTNAKELIYTNDTILNLLGYESIDDFKKDYDCVCELFVADEDDYLAPMMDGMTWVEYLLKHQNRENLKAKFIINDFTRIYAVHAKTISHYGENLYLVIFDEITDVLKERENLENVAFTDSLTNITNRRRFSELLDIEFKYSKEAYRDLSLLFIDIDHFKTINDTFGHEEGDEVLKKISKILKENIRKHDILARWGGEEFIVLLPLSDGNEAYMLAEKLRILVEGFAFSAKYSVEISVGISQLKENDSTKDFISRADGALYAAKNSGRNQVKMGI